VHYVNLIIECEVPRFWQLLGADCENPRALPNVHSCYLRAALHEPHPELTALIDDLDPDRIVGVGDIAAYLIKGASPERELIFLTAGCMQVDPTLPFTDQWASNHGSGTVHPRAWKERAAVEMSEMIVTHSPMIRDCYLRFYADHADRIHRDVIWFAEWIAHDAEEYLRFALPFEERDMDALFVASSWTRPEKNALLVGEIAALIPELSLHVAGHFAEGIPYVTHDGFVATRQDLFRLMGRARTVVSPSLFDAAPGILFEASVMGCNVVTSKNSGNWALCNDKLLVRDYTAEGFANAIRAGRREKVQDNLRVFLDGSSYRALANLLTDTSPANRVWPGDPIIP
jgi:hypothetical protein